jgi:hypothetical protein
LPALEHGEVRLRDAEARRGVDLAEAPRKPGSTKITTFHCIGKLSQSCDTFKDPTNRGGTMADTWVIEVNDGLRDRSVAEMADCGHERSKSAESYNAPKNSGVDVFTPPRPGVPR